MITFIQVSILVLVYMIIGMLVILAADKIVPNADKELKGIIVCIGIWWIVFVPVIIVVFLIFCLLAPIIYFIDSLKENKK